MQKTKKPRRKIKAKYVILAASTALIVIVAAIVILYLPKTPQKVSDYLKIGYATSLGRYFPNSTNPTYVDIKNLGLNITAVGGDANSIYVQIDEGRIIDPENEQGYVYATLFKGQSWYPAMLLEGVRIPVVNGTCTVNIDVSCHEVGQGSKETITLVIPLDHIIGVSG